MAIINDLNSGDLVSIEGFFEIIDIENNEAVVEIKETLVKLPLGMLVKVSEPEDIRRLSDINKEK